MMRRFLGITLVSIAAAALLAATAQAHRVASSSQLYAMVYDASGKYYLNAPPTSKKIPLKCFSADISTVPGGSSWAALEFSPYAIEVKHASTCQTGNGISILHEIHGRWYLIWEGSEGYPPSKPTKEGSGKHAFTLQPVPRAIAKDLRAGLS